MKALSPNYRTAREFPDMGFLSSAPGLTLTGEDERVVAMDPTAWRACLHFRDLVQTPWLLSPLLLAHTVAHCLPPAPTSSIIRRNPEPHCRRPGPAQPGPWCPPLPTPVSGRPGLPPASCEEHWPHPKSPPAGSISSQGPTMPPTAYFP